MKCTQCGAEVTADAKFCSGCGAPISESTSEPRRKPQAEKSKPRKSLTVWLVIVGIALFGTYAAMFIPAFVGQAPSTNPPTGLGVMIWTSLFFYLAWKQQGRKGWQGALIGTAVGFLAFTGAIIVAANNKTLDSSNAVAQLEKEKAGVEQIVDMLEELYDESQKVNPDGTLALIDKTFVPSEDATGSMAIMQQFVADIANESATLINDYTVELQAIGLTVLFDEDHLLSDPTFKKSWHIIAEARLTVDKYKNRAMEITMNTRDRIQFLNLSDKEKRDIEEGFKRGLESSTDFRERSWELERLAIDEMEKVIDLLAEAPQTWEIEEGQFLFESDQQIDQFNEHRANLDKFIAEQVELQESQVKKQRQRIEELF